MQTQELSIELTATVGLTTDTQSIEEFNELANQVFRIGEPTDCGDIDFSIVSYGDNGDTSFISISEVRQEITLEPKSIHETGSYDELFLMYYFKKNRDRVMYVQLAVTIQPCNFTSVAFESEKLIRTQFLGSGDKVIDWPSVVTEPDCDVPKFVNGAVLTVN